MGGSHITLNSPYGTVNTGVYSRSEYAALVKEGNCLGTYQKIYKILKK